MALVGTTVVVLAETLRVLFPLLYHFAEEIGFLLAAGVIPLIFLAPFALPLIRRAVGPRGALVATVGTLLAARVIMQALSPTLALAATGSMAGFGALAALAEACRRGGGFLWDLGSDLTNVLESRRLVDGGRALAGGVLAGLLLDAVIRLAFASWDPAWQSGVWPWVSCLALVGVGGAALIAVVRRVGAFAAGSPPGTVTAIGAFGPFLVLQVLVLASPAFIASSARISLAAAGAVVLLGLAAGFATLAAAVPRSPAGPIVAGAALGAIAGALTGAHALSGWWPVIGVIAAQSLAGWLLAVAGGAGVGRTDTSPGRMRAWWRSGTGAGIASVLFVAVLLPYQIHYELPLPFSNRLLPAVAGLLLGVFAVRGVTVTERPRRVRPAAAGGAAALFAGVVPLLLAITAPTQGAGDSVSGADGDGFRLVSYNIHEAVDVHGRLDPEAIAGIIEAQHADVVTLQEVGRGWPLSGTMDVGSWLARRLDMQLVYGPTADHQFGNAILTDLPVDDIVRGRLPRGDGTMVRGYVMAEIQVGGRAVEVWTTHLQHQDHTTRTRIAQLGEVIDAWGRVSPAVITGDMNARPGSAEMRVWFGETELRSAQDVTGHSELPTCCWPTVDHRIDWVLGTPELRFTDFAIIRTTASDHLPQAVTVRVRGS